MTKVKLAMSIQQFTNMIWPILQERFAEDLKGFTQGETVNVGWFVRSGILEVEVSSK